MADIQEIPLDIGEEVQVIARDLAEIKADEEPEPPQDAPTSEEAKPVIKPKAKGRPTGALNKAPSKPRTKRLKTPLEKIAYEPFPPKRNLKLPTDPNTSDVAAAMLKLLQDQSYSRQSKKTLV